MNIWVLLSNTYVLLPTSSRCSRAPWDISSTGQPAHLWTWLKMPQKALYITANITSTPHPIFFSKQSPPITPSPLQTSHLLCILVIILQTTSPKCFPVKSYVGVGEVMCGKIWAIGCVEKRETISGCCLTQKPIMMQRKFSKYLLGCK